MFAHCASAALRQLLLALLSAADGGFFAGSVDGIDRTEVASLSSQIRHQRRPRKHCSHHARTLLQSQLLPGHKLSHNVAGRGGNRESDKGIFGCLAGTGDGRRQFRRSLSHRFGREDESHSSRRRFYDRFYVLRAQEQ